MTDVRLFWDFRRISLVCLQACLVAGMRLICIAGQEPGSNDEIQEFCQLNYGVTFPVLGKIDVNGDKADPVYQYLKSSKSGILGLTRIKYPSPSKWS